MKIGIFTLRSVNPLHPRLAAFIDYFNKRNIACEIVPGHVHAVFSRINWRSLFFFDDWSVIKNRKRIPDFDIIFINDLKLLPVSRYAKRHNKVVVYDTIDNNVALRGYSLQKKIPVLKPVMKWITAHFTKAEKKLASEYCDRITVNSMALYKYFNAKAEVVYYYSFFENMPVSNNPENSLALLYLGDFSADKGAAEVLELRRKLDTELFIFGTVHPSLKKDISDPHIHHSARMSREELSRRIRNIMENYFLAGTSFIKPVHFSYATQEANKDIDYLALGTPIIGNNRGPTAAKIDAGCGIRGDDEEGLMRLKNDQEYRAELASGSREYYMRTYSSDIFDRELDKIFGEYSDL